MNIEKQEGKLELIVGPMYAGKTTKLLDLYEKTEGGVLVKSTMDKRYANNDIVTHNGKRYEAHSCENSKDILYLAQNSNSKSNLFIDEIQFFDEDILIALEKLKNDGINVVAAGLYSTFENNPFPLKASSVYTMKHVISLADKIHRLYASCATCGGDAAYTHKTGGTKNIIEVGGKDIYEPRCGRHYPYVSE